MLRNAFFKFFVLACVVTVLLTSYSYMIGGKSVTHTSSFKISQQKESKKNHEPYVCVEKFTQNNNVKSAVDFDFYDFEGFDNNDKKANFSRIIVPNIVHLIYLNFTEIKFYQMINIFSIFLNHRPDHIFIHCLNCSFHGRYWDRIRAVRKLMDIIVLKEVAQHNTIYGVKTFVYHRADILRLLILSAYGGIYLDNDVFVVNSFDQYRVYEMTAGWHPNDKELGSQILIANRNARLLKTYIDLYRTNYTQDADWYFVGKVITPVLLERPYLMHRVDYKFGVHMLIGELFESYWPEWREYTSLHLLINHRYYLDEKSPHIKEFDEFNTLNYNYTYGYMVRDVIERIEKSLKL